jgi:chromosome segregation ATPase
MWKTALQAAQEGGEAALALDLIKYHPEHKAAIEYVFGRAFVCRCA